MGLSVLEEDVKADIGAGWGGQKKKNRGQILIQSNMRAVQRY